MEDGKEKIQPEGDTPNQTDTENLSDFEKLKASNDAFEKELVRGRELKAEKQKLEAERMLGGETGGHVEAPVVSPEDAKTAKAKEFFKGTALGDAIAKSNE